VHTARSSFWYWTYLSNWVAPFGGLHPALPHLWSLAVEEQFYVVWPVLVALCGDRALAAISILLIAGALIVRIGVHAVYPESVALAAAYTWTTARFDAIAFGALVALIVRHSATRELARRHTYAGMTVMAFALLVVTAAGRGLAPEGALAERFAQPLAGALSACVVVACVVPRPAGRSPALVRWLSPRWLTTIGKYSYALYVFHMPIHHLLRPYVTASLAAGPAAERFLAHVGYTLAVFGLS